MNDFSSVRFFRLSAGGVECDERGLRVGDVALLARDEKGAWAARAARELGCDLSRVYGFPVDVRAKICGFGAVANALQDQNIAKAQIAALLLQLPDPVSLSPNALSKSAARRLSRDLVACGLMKADDGWDEKHPRTGAPPNPGWFAPKSQDAGAEGEEEADEPPKAVAQLSEGASSHNGASGGERAFAPLTLAPSAESVLAENLSASALDGLTRLAARFSAPAILFGAIFVPSANRVVDEGAVPGRPDITYRWARDEAQVTFSALIDGQWRALTGGTRGPDDAYYNRNGEIVARIVMGSGRATLVTSLDVLVRALANLHRLGSELDPSPTLEGHPPKLCPDPTPEPKTFDTSPNSIAYQEYVTRLPYGLAVVLKTVRFDGCDPRTGDMLEAKAGIDFMFDGNDDLNTWIYDERNPEFQMVSQADEAAAEGRVVVWHAQTEKGYRGLNKIAGRLGKKNLYFVYDPN